MDTTVADPLVGQVLDGRYRVDSRIARGGMATVYAGHDMKLDRPLALKVMHANLAADEAFVRRFIGEAKHAAALSHPNVVAVYDQGTDKGYVFLAMEYVPGRTLRDLLGERGRLGPREALQLMRPVLAALTAAHRAGMIHRDVKPENVLLTADGQVKVTDFGLARAETASKQTKTGMLIGTVGYLAPEQVVSGDADTRTDVYAAGIMLFELLTGRQPHRGETPLAVAYKHVNDIVPLPSSVIPGLPPQVDALVAGATNRDPARRPADAGHFLAAATEVLRLLPADIDATLAGVAPQVAPEGATRALGAPPVPTSGATQMLGPPDGATRALSAPPGGHTMAIRYDADPPPLTRGRRLLQPPGRYALIAAGLVVLLLIGGITWFTLGNNAQVPKLIGLTEEDARVKAENVGLKVKIGPSRYDDQVPKDRVADVTPKVGTNVEKGTILTLIISKGRKPVAVPDVRGRTLEQAKQILRQRGLQPGDVVQQESTTVQAGVVIKTRPGAGAEQSPDDPVTIVVSSGIKMPDLLNKPRAEAQQTLNKLGLLVQWQEQDPVDGQPENTVIAQQPPAGTAVTRGQAVVLTVTKGHCQWWDLQCQLGGDKRDHGGPVAVPDVRGRPIALARQQLKQSGFEVVVQNGKGRDLVTGQSPAPGTQQPVGSTIAIWH